MLTIPLAMGNELSTPTGLGPEENKAQRPKTKANTSLLLSSSSTPSLCCWRLKIDYCFGASDYKPVGVAIQL